MRSIKILTVALSVFSVFASYSQQANLENGVNDFFRKSDKNQDGFIEKAEVEGKPIYKNFAKGDKDADGKLTKAELKAFMSKWKKYRNSTASVSAPKANVPKDAAAEKNFKWLDKNKDGQLTLNEVKGKPLLRIKGFDRIDSDGSKGISLSEFIEARKSMGNGNRNNRSGKAKKFGAPKLSKAKKKAYVKKPRFNYEKFTYEELFAKFDADKNKKLERAEVTERSLQTDFSRIDKNGDEKLTKKELKKYLEKINK